MQAIRFHYRPVRYLLTRALSGRLRAGGAGRLGYVLLDEVEAPALPGDDWVRVEPRLSGICGTDLGLIAARDSFTLEPFGAYPFTLGHEVVGRVAEVGGSVTAWVAGDDVVVNPMLACRQRGEAPCGACAEGRYGMCRRIADGAGAMTGFSPLTGGGWSGSMVAHESQLHAADGLGDETALLADPFVTAVKASLVEPPVPGDTVLIIGAGTIGLLLVRALRATGWSGPIAVSARYDFQAERAAAAGADPVLRSGDALYDWAASLPGARAHDPTLAAGFVEGGPSLVYDTVGSQRTVRDALALTREGGRMVMIGAAGRLTADWTRLWYRQIRMTGVVTYGAVRWRGEERDVFDVGMELIRGSRLDELGLVTHVFSLEEYRDAIAVALGKDGHGSIKVAFRPGG